MVTDECEEDVLPKTDRDYLMLYTNYLKNCEQIDDVTLLNWQQELLKHLDNQQSVKSSGCLVRKVVRARAGSKGMPKNFTDSAAYIWEL